MLFQSTSQVSDSMETMFLSYVPSQEPSRISVAACTNNLWTLSWNNSLRKGVHVGWIFEASDFFISFTGFPLFGWNNKNSLKYFLADMSTWESWDMTSNLLGATHPIGVRGQFTQNLQKRTDWFFYKTTQKYIPAQVFTKRFWSSISFGICFSMSVEMRNTPGLQVSMSRNSNFWENGSMIWVPSFRKGSCWSSKLYLGICCLKSISGCFLWEGLGSS